MPKNTRGGNKAKKGKNYQPPKTFITKDPENQDYAKITKCLGNCRFEVLTLQTNIPKIGHIRGNMQKKIWIKENDIVIISLRDFQDNKCDIIHKYDNEEIKQLIKLNEIQKETLNNNQNDEDCVFDFNEI